MTSHQSVDRGGPPTLQVPSPWVDGPLSLEERLRVVRERCRLMADVFSIQAEATFLACHVSMSADAYNALTDMCRSSADDLERLAQDIPGAIANWCPIRKETPPWAWRTVNGIDARIRLTVTSGPRIVRSSHMSDAATGRARSYGDAVRAGDTAPDFTLPDQTGRPVTLRSLRGRTVVLYFYPRDHIDALHRAGLRLPRHLRAVQPGGRGNRRHQRRSAGLARRLRASARAPLPAAQRCRRHGQERCGVPRLLGILPGRVTYVIDPQGVVRDVIHSSFSVRAHVQGSLRIAENLRRS